MFFGVLNRSIAFLHIFAPPKVLVELANCHSCFSCKDMLVAVAWNDASLCAYVCLSTYTIKYIVCFIAYIFFPLFFQCVSIYLYIYQARKHRSFQVNHLTDRQVQPSKTVFGSSGARHDRSRSLRVSRGLADDADFASFAHKSSVCLWAPGFLYTFFCIYCKHVYRHIYIYVCAYLYTHVFDNLCGIQNP